MKTNSFTIPPVIQDLGTGYFLFNHSVTETIDENTIISYDYESERIQGAPIYDTIVKHYIRKEYSVDDELKINREMNSYNDGVTTDKAIRERFIKYNTYVENIKQMIKENLQTI